MSILRIFTAIRTLLLTAALGAACLAPSAYAEPPADMAQTKPAVVTQSTKINLNTANAQTLADGLNGIGLKKAQAIVTFREQHGPFKTVDDLVNVPGIGEATVAKNREQISIN